MPHPIEGRRVTHDKAHLISCPGGGNQIRDCLCLGEIAAQWLLTEERLPLAHDSLDRRVVLGRWSANMYSVTPSDERLGRVEDRSTGIGCEACCTLGHVIGDGR